LPVPFRVNEHRPPEWEHCAGAAKFEVETAELDVRSLVGCKDFDRRKVLVFFWKRSISSGRKIVLPSVLARCSFTQPMPFSARDSVVWMLTFLPVSALQ